MDWQDVGRKIAKSAPLLGTVIGGPLGGALGGLISTLASSFGLSEDSSVDQIMKAIEADPDAGVKLKEIELNHKIRLEKLALESDVIHLQDRADARSREVKIAQATGKKDINIYALAWIMVIGFFALCGLLMKYPMPEGQSDVIFMLFGALASGFGAVIQYFFGSSKSSADKTALLVTKE